MLKRLKKIITRIRTATAAYKLYTKEARAANFNNVSIYISTKDSILESFCAPNVPTQPALSPANFPEKKQGPIHQFSPESPTVLFHSSYSLMAESKVLIWLPETKEERRWQRDRKGGTEEAKAK